MTPFLIPSALRRVPTALAAAALLGCVAVAVDVDVAGAACSATPACLEATFPADYAWGPLDAGSGGNVSVERVIAVTSTDPWGITIASDLADGRMREWTGTAYVTSAPKTLANALDWGLTRINATPQTPNYAPLSSTAASVVSAQPATCTATCSSSEIAIKYRQIVSFGDIAAGTNDYRIEVRFEAAQGF